MKLGILGTGKIVQETLPALCRLGFERIDLLATERSRNRAEELKNRYGLGDIFFEYDRLLRSNVDTLYIALPNGLHYDYTKQALLAGKHVILEKPAVPTLAQLQELAGIARERNCMLFEAMNIHYYPPFLALKDALPRIGAPKIALLNFSQYSSRYDDFNKGVIQPVFDPAQAGGALMDLNVYNIHAALALFGQPESVSYHANVTRGIDTSGILTMDYPGFKVVAIGAKDCRAAAGNTIQGERGYLQIDCPVSQMDGFSFVDSTGAAQTFTFPPEYRLYREFVYFKDAIERRDYARAEAAMQISMAACGIMEEARTQAGIRFDR